jgi:aconitate hydratase
LQFKAGESVAALGLSGTETYDVVGLADRLSKGLVGGEVTVVARDGSGEKTFTALVRIDTPNEVRYYQHGGILQYVLRQLLQAK